MKILVTGAAGFIGSHLCFHLIDRGHSVEGVDNLITGRIENIKPLLSNGLFKLELMDTIYIDGSYDQVYHLASPTAPADVQFNPEETVLVNTSGTKVALQLAEVGLFVSSVKVYGECNRVQPYIKGKREGENIAFSMGAKVARLASVYGPHMRLDDSRVIPTFITKCLRNEPISVWNGGVQIDSFCYVDDVVRGLISFMQSEFTGVIEFGAEKGISILNLALLIKELTNSTSTIVTSENVLVVDECHKVVDTTTAQRLLGWEPTVDLTEGLKRTIAYFRKEINNVAEKAEEGSIHSGNSGLGSGDHRPHISTFEEVCQKD